MPTGHTAPVQDGTVTTVSDYLKSIARGFGGFVHQRDEPADAPLRLPDAPKESYAAKTLRKSREEVRLLETYSEEIKQQVRDAEYERAVERYHERNRETQVTRERYERMIEKVRAWKHPTLDHEAVKLHALRQLLESIQRDCNTSYNKVPKLVAVDEWFSDKIRRAVQDVNLHSKSIVREAERMHKARAWSEAFLDSLPLEG